MQFRLTLYIWTYGDNNGLLDITPAHCYSDEHRHFHYRNMFAFNNVVKALKNTGHKIDVPEFTPENPMQIWPVTGIEMIVKQRHLRTLVPYLQRFCRIHNIHAEFNLRAVVRFNQPCQRCKGIDSRAKIHKHKSGDEFLCEKCTRERKGNWDVLDKWVNEIIDDMNVTSRDYRPIKPI